MISTVFFIREVLILAILCNLADPCHFLGMGPRNSTLFGFNTLSICQINMFIPISKYCQNQPDNFNKLVESMLPKLAKWISFVHFQISKIIKFLVANCLVTISVSVLTYCNTGSTRFSIQMYTELMRSAVGLYQEGYIRHSSLLSLLYSYCTVDMVDLFSCRSIH